MGIVKCAPGAQGQNCSGSGPPSLLQPPQSSHLWPDFQEHSVRDGEASGYRTLDQVPDQHASSIPHPAGPHTGYPPPHTQPLESLS